ncbi:flippase [Methanobacterium formicicum]|uniref:Polysaccharide biosynthesis protein n=1 Tax=Methanobacterium formicicum (strain DSM 3637 / PP1) TaxID=1204725 RepID=K2R1U2_METFP|nr:flippase [Methanobacterium formicicum]EKF86488.1 polysaccharide biosynthesis protein [Methanobacterium formicicum DSM 3637]
MNTTQKIAKNTSLLLISQVLSFLLAFFYTLNYANYLGAAGFGIISAALALAGILTIFTDLGLTTLTVREVARDKSLASKYIGNITIIKLIFSIVTLIATFIIVQLFVHDQQSSTVIYIITTALIFGVISGTFSAAFQAYQKMEYQSIATVLYSILMFAGIYIAIYYNSNILAFAMVFLIINFLILLFNIAICLWKFVVPRFELDLKLWKSLIIESYPLAVSSIFAVIAFKIDTIMLSFLAGDVSTGLYSAAYKLLEALMFIPSVYATAILPVFSKFHIDSRESLQFSYYKSFKYLSMLGIPIAVGTTLLANEIILLLFQSGYIQAIPILQILIWAIPIIFVSYVIGASIISINRQHETMRISFICMLLNVILNLIFIPKYGYIGAAVVTVITELSLFLFYYHLISKYLCKIKLRKVLLKPIIASFIMALSIILIKTIMVKVNLWVIIIIATITYFAVLILLKSFTKSDKEIFKDIRGKYMDK